MVPKSVVFAVLILVVAYLYNPEIWQQTIRKIQSKLGNKGDGNFETGADAGQANVRILNAWQEIIKEPTQPKRRIAVGINVNADLIVSGTELLKALGQQATGKSFDHPKLNSLQQLQEAFSYFFERGAAVERYFANGKKFKSVIQAAESLEEKNYFVGGNAALMALKIAASFQESEILLVGPSGPKIRNMLIPNIQIPASSIKDIDEVHLIMEYAKGEKWGQAVAPVATRFITSHDISNSHMDSLDGLADNIKEFKPDLIVFSGLHLLDGQIKEFRSERISRLLDQLKQMPPSVPLHLELASMADHHLIKQLYSEVIGAFDSLGLNEQELALMSKANKGPHPNLKAVDGYSDIPAVADILFWILSQKSATSLTRVHFHSLTYHIIAIRKGHWGNSESAVAAGARTGGLQACDENPINPDKVEIRIPLSFYLSINDPVIKGKKVTLNPDSPGLSWERDHIQFYFSPVLVCKVPLKTVGLGDAISGTGFVFSDKLEV